MAESFAMKRMLLAGCLLLLTAWFPHGTTTLPNTPLTVFNLGGGGNISGQNISATGVRFVRGDVFGGYIFGTDNTWHLINGETNMCPSGIPCPYFGYNPANTAANQVFVGF